jgi:TolB-like protein
MRAILKMQNAKCKMQNAKCLTTPLDTGRFSSVRLPILRVGIDALLCSLFSMLPSLFLCGGIGAEPPTNLELLHDVVKEAVTRAVGDMAVTNEMTTVVLVPETPHSAEWLMTTVISEVLSSRGIRVVTDRVSTNHTLAPRFSYLIVDLSVTYPDQRRDHLIGAKRVTRVARVKLSFQLIDGETHRILWMREETASRIDRFLKEDLLAVQSDLYSFAKADLYERSLSRVFEPIIVSGVVGGLIYLFFSNR